jgi:hypothetical protein
LSSETKRESFHQSYIRNFCAYDLDSFDYIPSIGASGGMIIIWKSSKFNGHTVFHNSYAMSIEFVSTISGATWVLTNIYAPSSSEGKINFWNDFQA